jgi:hypothetical protein
MNHPFRLVLAAFATIATAAAAEPTVTAKTNPIVTPSRTPYFWIHGQVPKDLAPGLRFYTGIRLVFEDETWMPGYTGCFPTGAEAGKDFGGDSYGSGTAQPAKVIKRIGLVAQIGDPQKYLMVSSEDKIIPPLSDEVLAKLKRDGAFVISISVEPKE